MREVSARGEQVSERAGEERRKDAVRSGIKTRRGKQRTKRSRANTKMHKEGEEVQCEELIRRC